MVTKIVCRKLSDFKETEIKDNTQEKGNVEKLVYRKEKKENSVGLLDKNKFDTKKGNRRFWFEKQRGNNNNSWEFGDTNAKTRNEGKTQEHPEDIDLDEDNGKEECDEDLKNKT